jgi:hypothetical protein
VQSTSPHARLVDIGGLDKPQLAKRRASHLASLLTAADSASTGFQHQIQAKLAHHGEDLVELHCRLALLKRMNEASGHTGKRGKLVLVKSKLKPPAPDLLSQDNRAACTIVHTKESTQESRP